MLKVRAANTKPTLATIFLVGSPVAFHSQEFSTLATHERFKSMLPLIMCLQCSKIFQGLCSWVFDIVLAPFGATEAWNACHSPWLCSLQRFMSSTILWSMTPQVHLAQKSCDAARIRAKWNVKLRNKNVAILLF